MMWAMPQYDIEFSVDDKEQTLTVDVRWKVSGEDALDSLCKTLRWNGISKYAVASHDWKQTAIDPEQGDT